MLVIHHSTREFIFATARNRLHIRLQTDKKSLVKCTLIYWNRFHTEEIFGKTILCVGADASLNYYECDFAMNDPAQYIQYYFELETAGGVAYWGRNGYEKNKPNYNFEYLATAELDILTIPQWAKGSAWYQIFPERFFNGNTANDTAEMEPWGAVPTRENHFGGDLAGIAQKIPHLQKLGIDVLYMTPVFLSPSNHKYDTKDYFEIDPTFGTKQELIDLVSKCHEVGIKVVLDGVFNHIGYYSKQFQDVVNKGEKSEYADWFYISQFPIETDPLNYECVGYYKWMPKLRFKTKAVRDFFIKVGRYWIETADIDGWRLDVADEVDFTFWQEFRRVMKEIKPDVFLLAETWKDGRDMLRGDQMDSVMNYLFRDAVVDFFAKQEIDALTFEHRISQMLFGYSKAVRPVLYNPLGSHDTTRFLTLCNGDVKKLKLAVAFQMTFSGMPATYYGDEIGMDGENDPDCRKTMAWDNVNKDLLSFYKKLSNLRKELPSLKYGDVKCIYAQDNNFAFARQYENETSYIIINNSDKRHSAAVATFTQATQSTLHQSFFTDTSISMQPLNDNISIHNQDLFNYKSLMKIELEAYEFEIITIKSN